jgi:PAS domain S-box-containing protein
MKFVTLKKFKLKNPGHLVIAAILPIAASVLQWIFWPLIDPFIWIWFFPAVFFSSRIDGMRGALTSTILCVALVLYFFMPQKFSFSIEEPKYLLSVIIFITMSLLVGYSQELFIRQIIRNRKTEAALSESEKKYRQIVETSLEGIITLTPEGEFIYVNARFAEILGYPVEEFYGKKSTDYMTEDQAIEILKLRSQLKMGVALQEEIKFRKKDGNIVWTLCSASPVYDENGHHISNLATHIDITNRKKLEEELALSEQLHNLMIMHLRASVPRRRSARSRGAPRRSGSANRPAAAHGGPGRGTPPPSPSPSRRRGA